MNYRSAYAYVRIGRAAGNAYIPASRYARTGRERERERERGGRERGRGERAIGNRGGGADGGLEGREGREEKRPSEQQVAGRPKGVKEPLSSCLFSSGVLVLEKDGARGGGGEVERDAGDGTDSRVRAHVCAGYTRTLGGYSPGYVTRLICC